MSEKDDDSTSRFANLGLTEDEFDEFYGNDVRAGKWCRINHVAKSKLNAPGVYMIRTPSHDLVWNGRTIKGIAKRAWQHIHSQSESNLNVRLRESSNFPQYNDDNPEFLKKDLEYFEMYFTKVMNKEEQKNVEKHMMEMVRLLHAELLLNKLP